MFNSNLDRGFVPYDSTLNPFISVEPAAEQDKCPILIDKHRQRRQQQSNFECNNEPAAAQQDFSSPFSTENWQHESNFESDNEANAAEQEMFWSILTENGQHQSNIDCNDAIYGFGSTIHTPSPVVSQFANEIVRSYTSPLPINLPNSDCVMPSLL